MYSNYPNYPMNNSNQLPSYSQGSDDDRIIGGGFVAPFLLGGLAGAALAPRPYYPSYYPPYYPPYYPRPYYPPYYYRRYPRYYY